MKLFMEECVIHNLYLAFCGVKWFYFIFNTHFDKQIKTFKNSILKTIKDNHSFDNDYEISHEDIVKS